MNSTSSFWRLCGPLLRLLLKAIVLVLALPIIVIYSGLMAYAKFVVNSRNLADSLTAIGDTCT